MLGFNEGKADWTDRLNLQHFLWKQQLGYNLHPQIPTDSPDLKIADVATGTG